MFADDDHVFSALRAGASGYLLKKSEPNELIQEFRDVAAGKPALHPAIVSRVIHRVARTRPAPTSEALTKREKEVLTLVAQGLSNRAVAGRLLLSERTVRSYVSTILAMLSLCSRTEAALYALRTGLVRIEEWAQ